MQRIGLKKQGSIGGKDQVLFGRYFCPGTQAKKVTKAKLALLSQVNPPTLVKLYFLNEPFNIH